MAKKYYIIEDKYKYEMFLEHPIFDYFYMLKKEKMISDEDYYFWVYKFRKELTKIEIEVSFDDVIDFMLKNYYKKGVSREEAASFISSPNFNYDKVIENIKFNRVMYNADAAAERIRKTMIDTFIGAI